MNRLGKGLRVLGGVLILCNIIIFFLPMTQSIRENYPTKTWSQLQYVTNVMSDGEPYMTSFATNRMIWVLCLIVLPVLLAALTGIWGIVGDDRQIVSPILSLIVLGLYIGLFLSVTSYYPEKSYSRDLAGILNLACSGSGALLSVIGLCVTPQKKKVAMTQIPQIQEMKKEQIEARYNIIEEKPVRENSDNNISDPKIPPYVPGTNRGVMVGLTGAYKGAEIPFKDGERIRLGRSAENELIFDDSQKKVSRNHCVIKWDGQNKEYLLRDNSTNGTFLNGFDDCMPKNLEIVVKPGTIVALGDEQNTFRLE